MVSSLYIHIPFCDSICYYCDFTRVKYHKEIADKYLLSLKEQLIKEVNNKFIKTIYIGGGTPSCLNEEQLEFLLETIKPFAQNVIEYTFEANVESLDKSKIKILKRYGINRVSLGVQSFDDQVLKRANRAHSAEDVSKAIELLRNNGINNISIDLIYGLPLQNLKSFEKDLEKACSLNVEHISLYSLTLEENSVFKKQNVQLIDNELEAMMYQRAIDYLNEHGFEQYEISNFCQNNHYSKHNMVYWDSLEYYGIGLGASGYVDDIRYDNTKNFDKYLNGNYHQEETKLTLEEKKFEYLMLGLRKKKGISISEYQRRFNSSLLIDYQNELKKAFESDFLNMEGDMLKTSLKGMFLLHDLLVIFMK